MRFFPYNHSTLQDSKTADGDVVLKSEHEMDVEALENSINANDSNSFVDDINILNELLDDYSLKERFNLASSIFEKSGSFKYSQYESIPEELPNPTRAKSEKPQDKSTYEELFKPSDVSEYITSSFLQKLQQNKTNVATLIRQEEERLKKIEEEKQRKFTEEKKRKEEEERRVREEQERKARKEAERKRIEEEEKRQKEEDERKRREQKEQREKEMREKLAKEQELKKKKEQEQLKLRQEEETRRAVEEAKNSIFKPKEVEKVFFEQKENKNQIEITIVKAVTDNKELKKIVGSHKRKINPKFGQLTNSQEQLTRITSEIRELVIETQQNELAYKWILNFISDAIISQAETEVSVKPNSSIPLAKLTLNLMIMFPEFPKFMLTKFYNACPLLIGYSCSQDTEEGRMRMGWNRDEDSGKWEKEASYNERLAGISTLFAVISRLKLDHTYLGYDPSSTKHPLPICNSWAFLARMVDLPASEIAEIHYVAVGSWWDACCQEFIQAYGRQASKLLALVSQDWTSVGNKSSAGRVRLNLLAEELAKGVIKVFPSMES